MTKPLTIPVANLAATDQFATHLAAHLQPGSLVILNGGLGAGKTHIVKAVAAALSSADEVSSPTYTIANVYRIASGNLLHIDAYRLESNKEFWDLGLEDYFEEGIVFMEWGAKYAEDFEDYLTIDIAIDKEDANARTFQLTATGTAWKMALTQLATTLKITA